MKKLVCSLLFVIMALFAVDRVGGVAMQWVARHTNDVLGPKLRYLQHDVHEDVVFVGASRCHHHYVPSIVADSLGMSVYNAGVGGSDNIFSHYIVLCHILARYTPRVICLEVMPTDVCQQDDPFQVLSFFAPLYGTNASADSVYRVAGKSWQYQASHLLRYNAKAGSNLVGLVLNRQKGNDCGYIPLPKPKAHLQQPVAEEAWPGVDSLKIAYIERFISICRDRHIQLIFTISPKYTLVPPSHYDTLRQIARRHGIPLLDYHTRGLYLDHPEYFKDCTHLWDEGARRFSALFAKDLKKTLEDVKVAADMQQ